MLIIIEEASRRIPHIVISADAQDEQYQLGGGSERIQVKFAPQVCTKTDSSWDSCKVGKSCAMLIKVLGPSR